MILCGCSKQVYNSALGADAGDGGMRAGNQVPKRDKGRSGRGASGLPIPMLKRGILPTTAALAILHLIRPLLSETNATRYLIFLSDRTESKHLMQLFPTFLTVVRRSFREFVWTESEVPNQPARNIA